MPSAYLPALDDYGDAAIPLDRLMHRNRHIHCIRYAVEDGRWPTYEGKRVCKDKTGRWRARHEFIVNKRDGLHCCYCGVRARMEAL